MEITTYQRALVKKALSDYLTARDKLDAVLTVLAGPGWTIKNPEDPDGFTVLTAEESIDASSEAGGQAQQAQP